MTHRRVKEAKVLWKNDLKKERYTVEAYLLGRNSGNGVEGIKRRTQLHQSLIPYIPPKYCGSRTLHTPGKQSTTEAHTQPFYSLNKYLELFFEGPV